MENSRNSLRRSSRHALPLIFERALEEILARVCISATGTPVLAVAYSGGLDSSVLLKLAQDFARMRRLPLVALHIHHGLSPNADAWLQHCRNQAARLEIGFRTAQIRVDQSGSLGVEQAARLARYRQLGVLCRELGATVLLTGHHQDDQAETVFLQMMRGAGLPGLSGMPELQQDSVLLGGGIALGRPLLGVAHAALQDTARQLNLTYVDDESNADVRYRRNGVRHKVFPAVATEFPGFPARLARVAVHMQTAQRLLDEVAQVDLLACASGPGEALDITALKQLSTDRLGNLLRNWLYRQGVGLPSAMRLQEIRRQMFESAPDMQPFFDFGPVQLRRVGNRLELQPALVAMPLCPTSVQWRGQGAIDVPEWGGRLVFELTDNEGLAPERLRARQLLIRPRRGSERLKLALNQPSKNLKHLFQERAIPAWQRPRLPLVYLGEQLVFVGGVGMDARFAALGPGVILRWEAGPDTAGA